jgi:hypothetical protein
LKFVFGFTWSGGMSRVLVILQFAADCGLAKSMVDSLIYVRDLTFLVLQQGLSSYGTNGIPSGGTHALPLVCVVDIGREHLMNDLEVHF